MFPPLPDGADVRPSPATPSNLRRQEWLPLGRVHEGRSSPTSGPASSTRAARPLTSGQAATRRLRPQAFVRENAGAARAQRRQALSRRAPLRHPGAPRPPNPLGPAPRARRRPRLVGPAARRPADAEGQSPRRPHGGPSARVPRVRGRHSEGRVRRRHDEGLGPRDLRRGEVRRRQGRGRAARRARARTLRPLSHDATQLDDPSHGPARGARAGAAAGARLAHVRRPGQAPPAERGRLRLRAQVGRGAGARLLRARPGSARKPHGPRRELPVPGGDARPARDARHARGPDRR